MMQQFEDFQKLGKDNMDVAMKTAGAVSKSVQAIAVEMSDYSKKAFETSSSVVEKLVGVKTLDKAIEIQTDYAKAAYEGFVAHATKVGELYTSLAKEVVKPVETAMAKVQVTK